MISAKKPTDDAILLRGVRQNNLKLIVPESQDGAEPWNRYLSEPALFDVVSDPDESQNLIGDGKHEETRTHLRRLLDELWLPQQSATQTE